MEDQARRRLDMEPIRLEDEDLARIDALGSDQAIESLLGTLPPRQREAVAAPVLQEGSYAEIAGRLRCSESVIRRRVSRGLATLRNHLREESR